MNMPQFFRFIRTELKAALHHLPAIILYSVIFILTSGIIIHYSRKLLSHDTEIETASIGYSIEGNSLKNSFALGIITEMESFKESASLISYSSKEEGLDALKSGEILCFIYVPEGFIDSLFTGSGGDSPMDVFYSGNDTIEDRLVNDLLQSSAKMLGTAQTAYFTMYSVNRALEMDESRATSLETALDAKNLSYVLTRSEHFIRENYDSLSKYSIEKQLTGSYLILILFLSVFVTAYIYNGNRSVIKLRANSTGLGTPGLFMAETLVMAVICYGIFLLSYSAVHFAGLRPNLSALFLILPVILIISAIITFIIYTVKNPVTACIVTLFAVLLLLYPAGGLMPVECLPIFMQKAAAYNPFRYLIKFVLYIMWRQ